MTTTFPIEKFQSLPTPFYYYDIELLQQTLRKVASTLSAHPHWRMHYAIKANANPRLLSIISGMGMGADCVSGWEIDAAVKAGFKPESIVYAGVGKSDAEIISALNHNIGRFNVESEAELSVLNELAGSLGKKANVALRVNPDVGAHTHSNITTGLAENKFGISKEQLEDTIRHTLALPNVIFCGLHFHIGSQILDMTDFIALCNRINELSTQLQRKGLPVGDINVGGGLGVDYEYPDRFPFADFDAYFDTIGRHLLLHPGQLLHFELGRSLVAPCGSLITRVLYIKEGIHKQFAIVDGSMTELIRPALYHAFHRIQNISSSKPLERYDVVGPVCESSDVFGKAIDLPRCQRGDFIAIRTAGAYGETMASQYNCRPLPKAYYSSDI